MSRKRSRLPIPVSRLPPKRKKLVFYSSSLVPSSLVFDTLQLQRAHFDVPRWSLAKTNRWHHLSPPSYESTGNCVDKPMTSRARLSFRLRNEDKERTLPRENQFHRGHAGRFSLRMSNQGDRSVPPPSPLLKARCGSIGNLNQSLLSLTSSPASSTLSPSQMCLARSATTCTVPRVITASQSPKAFGGVTFMNKEDHERERSRWVGRMDDAEARLADAEVLNQDMHLIRAELNKKIVDLEKSQKPLIEQNKKLNERNKHLTGEVKKMQQKLTHSQEDFITLRDQHERLNREYTTMKERRAHPEKLEELDRYKSQVMEYSKCITALRQAGLEKDRRYELLVQKFKRLRRVMRNGGEDDQRSTVGSDCSAESSISLDTITEDFEEAVNKEIDQSYNALFRDHESLLGDLKIEDDLMRDCQSASEMASILKARLITQQATIKDLETAVERLQRELSEAREKEEVLEFQVIEMSENSKCEDLKCKSDACVETDLAFEDEEEEPVLVPTKMCPADVLDLKRDMLAMKASLNLKLYQRTVVGAAQRYYESLEQQLHDLKIESSGQINHLEAKERESGEKIKWLQAQVEESYSRNAKKKELQMECDELKRHLIDAESTRDEAKTTLNDMSRKLAFAQSAKIEIEEDLAKERQKYQTVSNELSAVTASRVSEIAKLEQVTAKQDGLIKDMKQHIETLENQLVDIDQERRRVEEQLRGVEAEYAQFREDQRPSIRTELERRYEETKYKLKAALDKVEALEAHHNNNEEVVQLREFNEHLEMQFQAQTGIIDTLKNKILATHRVSEELSRLADSAPLEDDRLPLPSDPHAKTLVDAVKKLLQAAKGKHPLTQPLEIHTAHHKVRQCNSADSSADWLSNSSDAVTSPDERASDEDDEWTKKIEKRCGGEFIVDMPATN